jgi:D-proline reductase (dithiol) PrdB
MADRQDDDLGFAPEYDRAVPYMERTRNYYLALGYANPYRWAQFAAVPFQPLEKPLAESCVALITTAALFDPAKGEQGPGAPYNAAAKFYTVYSADPMADPDLRISHIGYDRMHTTASDPRTYNPLDQMKRAVARGRIGRLASRFHGAPTNRSQRVTMEVDAPEILARCRADGVDVALLVPNCPVCHQTISLVARHLEENGIPTVVAGCAKDIVEHCGVPRLSFSDFPLGNAAGRPDDVASQAFTLEFALRILEAAPAARTTVQSPLRWSDDASWKLDYSNVDRIAPEELERRRREFAVQKEIARNVRQNTLAKVDA